jgi:ABC-type uncharacterized transport system fused permease/ATPase subunit
MAGQRQAIGGTITEGQVIQFNRVDCYTPAGNLLVRDLTFTLEAKQNLLIMGPSGNTHVDCHPFCICSPRSQEAERLQY